MNEQKMTDNMNQQNVYISVTHDFLQALNPEWDIDNNKRHLMAALRLVGFDVNKKFDIMSNVNIRYVHAPMYARETIVYQGQMISGYPFAGIYNNKEILDLNIKTDVNIDALTKFLTEKDKNGKLVSDFDFVDESSYIPEGGKEFKNQYLSKEDKKRYKIFNKNDEQLEILLEREEVFVSPFDSIEED